jgi:hypothetical protein
VRRRTGRGERTRQGEYDHGPVFEQFVTADIDPFVALAGFENYLRGGTIDLYILLFLLIRFT